MPVAVSRNLVVVKGTGAICSVGIGIRQIHASIQAGIGRLTESSVFDRSFQPIRMALVAEEALEPLIPELETAGFPARQRRMLRLAAPALREATGVLPERMTPIPLFVGLPEESPGSGRPLKPKDFLKAFAQQAGITIDQDLSQGFPRGRAGALLALEAAVRVLGKGEAESILVGGVDTFLDLRLLAQLDSEKRILGPRIADGFVPGEGAAFLLLDTSHRDRTNGSVSKVVVVGVASASEHGHRYSDQPARGEALSQAIAELMAALPRKPPPINSVFAGFNGESFDAKEWGVASLRCGEFISPTAAIEHPADCFGDTGAAAGALLIALAGRMLARGNRSAPALAFASSDREERACALLDVLA